MFDIIFWIRTDKVSYPYLLSRIEANMSLLFPQLELQDIRLGWNNILSCIFFVKFDYVRSITCTSFFPFLIPS